MTLFVVFHMINIMALVMAAEDTSVLQMPEDGISFNLYRDEIPINGVTDSGNVVKGSCFIPNPQQWGRTQLPMISIIGTITLIPRQDFGKSEYTYFSISMGDSSKMNWNLCQHIINVKAGWMVVKCPPTTGLKDIRITDRKGVQVAVCTMEPYGPTPPPTPPSAASLTVLYTLKKKKIKYGDPLTTLKLIGKEFLLTSQLCFNREIYDVTYSMIPVISIKAYGFPVPPLVIWLSVLGSESIMKLCSSCNGIYYCVPHTLNVDEKTDIKCHSVKIVQFKFGQEYRWQFWFDNKMVYNIVNKDPRLFKDVRMIYGRSYQTLSRKLSKVFKSYQVFRSLIIRSKV